MKKEELKLIIAISILMAILIAAVFMILTAKEFSFINGFRALSVGISSTTVLWTLYFSWGWKIWGLNKLFYRPNLNGTWSGKLKSDWKDAQGEPIGDIEFYIVIRQNFLSIHFMTFTDSFIGTSYSETISLNKEKGLKNLAYLYRKDTSQEDDEFLQEGATELRLIEGKLNRLEGKYWSNRKTNGKIFVSFLSKDKVDSFQDAQELKSDED